MYLKILAVALSAVFLHINLGFAETPQTKASTPRNLIVSFGKCTLASIDDSAKSIYVKGIFKLTGRCAEDAPNIAAVIWEIAKSHPRIMSLKLSITSKGVNEYGEVSYNEIGDTDEIDLEKARRYKSAYYYTRKMENFSEVLGTLMASFACSD